MPISSFPAEIIAGNTDLLSEILRRLPAKSLLRFKSVSEEWRFLVSSPIFAGIHFPQFSGVMLHRSSKSTLEFAFFDGGSHHRPNPSPLLPQFAVNNNSVRILQSCNGLLLCSVKNGPYNPTFHVYNPTTGSSATVPSSDGPSPVASMNLVFDPSESLHYQLIGIHNNQIKRFSSATGKWTLGPTQTHFKSPFNITLSSGIYWRGSLHWMGPTGDSFFLHIETGRFGPLPVPPMLRRKRRQSILESSGGKLIIMEVYQEGEIRVLEMKEDYSNWEVKYEIDAIKGICEVYPQVIGRDVNDESKIYYKFQVCCFANYGDDEEIIVVIRIPKKVLGYGLKSKRFWEMKDVLPSSENSSDFEWIDVYPYVETLAFV